MSFQDFAASASSSRTAGAKAAGLAQVPGLVQGAQGAVARIEAITAAIRADVEGKGKFDFLKTRGQVQEAFRLGTQAAVALKQIRQLDPDNAEAAPLHSQLTACLAALRSVHHTVLTHEKKVNAEAKAAVSKAKREVKGIKATEYSDTEATESEALMEAHKRKLKQAYIQSEIATNEALIAERETGIQDIEVALTEIAKIMKDMSHEVHSQGEQLEYIEDHIEHTLAQTKAGTAEVRVAMTHQRASRKRMCCLLFFVFGIVVFIVIYFSVFYSPT